MNALSRMARDTMTIARRDFMAIVATPTFLIFLLAPLIFIGFGMVGGMGGRMVGKNADSKERIYAVLDGSTARQFAATEKNMRDLFRGDSTPPDLILVKPQSHVEQQARALLAQQDRDVPAVLYGTLERPIILRHDENSGSAAYLAEVAERAARDRAAGIDHPLSTPHFVDVKRAGSSIGGTSATGVFAVTLLFVLTLMLSGQTVGTMAEERSNKVIEILAASVRLESVFLGKLIGMFGVAMLFIAFWGGLAALMLLFVPADAFAKIQEMRPAIGLPAFGILFLAYFTMAYLLLGSVFLGIGAQASTPREIQMLSLPITIFQMAMLGLASASVALPDAPISLIARIFPFSSPFAMMGQAARSATLWPHLVAIGWQLLWVAASISIGARLFRMGVLKSAGAKRRWRRKRDREVAATAP